MAYIIYISYIYIYTIYIYGFRTKLSQCLLSNSNFLRSALQKIRRIWAYILINCTSTAQVLTTLRKGMKRGRAQTMQIFVHIYMHIYIYWAYIYIYVYIYVYIYICILRSSTNLIRFPNIFEYVYTL